MSYVTMFSHCDSNRAKPRIYIVFQQDLHADDCRQLKHLGADTSTNERQQQAAMNAHAGATLEHAGAK
jgi:hypothetical protein